MNKDNEIKCIFCKELVKINNKKLCYCCEFRKLNPNKQIPTHFSIIKKLNVKK